MANVIKSNRKLRTMGYPPIQRTSHCIPGVFWSSGWIQGWLPYARKHWEAAWLTFRLTSVWSADCPAVLASHPPILALFHGLPLILTFLLAMYDFSSSSHFSFSYNIEWAVRYFQCFESKQSSFLSYIFPCRFVKQFSVSTVQAMYQGC